MKNFVIPINDKRASFNLLIPRVLSPSDRLCDGASIVGFYTRYFEPILCFKQLRMVFSGCFPSMSA